MGLQIWQKLSSLGPLLAFDAKVLQAARHASCDGINEPMKDT
jgi:hypothetical protein